MNLVIKSLCLAQLAVLCKVECQSENNICRFTAPDRKCKEIEQKCNDLTIPSQFENEENLQEVYMKWAADKKNQGALLQQIQAQIVEGGLSSSREIFLMMNSLKTRLATYFIH